MRSDAAQSGEINAGLVSQLHIPVLLNEAVDSLNIKPDGIYVDGTFGRGGHAKEILKRLNEEGLLVAIDKDPQAVLEGKKIEAKNGLENYLYSVKNTLREKNSKINSKMMKKPQLKPKLKN